MSEEKKEIINRQQWENQLDLVRSMFAQNCDDNEFALLCHVTRRFGLDPLAGHIQALKLVKDRPASILIKIHGMMSIARKSADYRGYELTWLDEKTVECRVYIAGIDHPFLGIARMAEDNKGQALWKTMPCFMLEKVAKARAHRDAYPDLFGNVYTEDEILEGNNQKQNGNTSPLASNQTPRDLLIGDLRRITQNNMNNTDIDVVADIFQGQNISRATNKAQIIEVLASAGYQFKKKQLVKIPNTPQPASIQPPEPHENETIPATATTATETEYATQTQAYIDFDDPKKPENATALFNRLTSIFPAWSKKEIFSLRTYLMSYLRITDLMQVTEPLIHATLAAHNYTIDGHSVVQVPPNDDILFGDDVNDKII